MSILSRFFNRKKIECPRCLGKGVVDLDDIKRLDKELHWLPGKCAYCNGRGKVSSSILAKVSEGNSYLTTDLSKQERNRLLNADEDAVLRANNYDLQIKNFIKQIEHLYFAGNMNLEQIVDFYSMPGPESDTSLTEREDLRAYIEKVINRKKNTG